VKTGLAFALELPQLLELPLQYLPKLASLLEEILKFTFKTSSDYAILDSAKSQIKFTADKVSGIIQTKQNADQLARISKTWTGLPDINGKVFIKEGSITKLCRKIPKKR
jgi:hypothetical protein